MPIFGHTPIFGHYHVGWKIFFRCWRYQIPLTFYSEAVSLVHIIADNWWAYHILLSQIGIRPENQFQIRIKPLVKVPKFTWEYIVCQYCRFIPYFCVIWLAHSIKCTPICVTSLIGSSGPLVPGWPNIGIGDIKIRLYSVSGSRHTIFNVPLVRSFEENIFW